MTDDPRGWDERLLSGYLIPWAIAFGLTPIIVVGIIAWLK